MRTLLASGSSYVAYSVSGSIGVCNGEYILCSHVVDVERLDVSIGEYSKDTRNNVKLNFTGEDIAQGLRNGNFDNVSDTETSEFIKWYIHGPGEGMTEAEMQRRY